jgi:hypothetical protein
MIAEYLEKALQFERMAADSSDAKLREKLLAQAGAYRDLAEKRALQHNIPTPPRPQNST